MKRLIIVIAVILDLTSPLASSSLKYYLIGWKGDIFKIV